MKPKLPGKTAAKKPRQSSKSAAAAAAGQLVPAARQVSKPIRRAPGPGHQAPGKRGRPRGGHKVNPNPVKPGAQRAVFTRTTGNVHLWIQAWRNNRWNNVTSFVLDKYEATRSFGLLRSILRLWKHPHQLSIDEVIASQRQAKPPSTSKHATNRNSRSM